MGGVLLVIQKVQELNDIADLIHEHYPHGGGRLITALQSLTPSGKEHGLCLNPDVQNYSECDRTTCPYAEECPLITMSTQGASAFLLGATQARFYAMRRDNRLDDLLLRQRDGELPPVTRRFVLFDEKPELYQICALDQEKINLTSSALEKLAQKGWRNDRQVCSLQGSLHIHVEKPFYDLRRNLHHEVDFCTLQGDTEQRESYLKFRDRMLQSAGLVNATFRDCLEVMDQLYGDTPILCCSTGGFRIYGIRDGMSGLESTQVMIFDATAEVDGDYQGRKDLRFLASSPTRSMKRVTFHLFNHKAMNTSRNAMGNAWKKEGMCKLIAELIEQYPGKTFLCVYRNLSRYFAQHLSPHVLKTIQLMEEKEPPCVPYFDGNNGSNSFRSCSNVILVGYPRLSPDTYLARTYAAWPQDLLWDIDSTPEKTNLRSLPSLNRYESHHLAARLEQEIYRCAIRNSDCGQEIHIFLFSPPKPVWEILCQRFPGCLVEQRDDLPDCVAECRDESRSYAGRPTAYLRIKRFLEQWDGQPISVSELRTQAEVSKSAWKELSDNGQLSELLTRFGAERTGRGRNTQIRLIASSANGQIPA